MNCSTCGKPFVRAGVGYSVTALGYFEDDGHIHDDNCIKRVYFCAEDHPTVVSKRRRCGKPGCDWVGKSDCFCHKGKKVDEWPKIHKEEPISQEAADKEQVELLKEWTEQNLHIVPLSTTHGLTWGCELCGCLIINRHRHYSFHQTFDHVMVRSLD